MFSYYGSKSKVIHFYPPPKNELIIEPFAGSAQYALRYFAREVILYDKYKIIVDLWNTLKAMSKKDILGLPPVVVGQNIDELTTISTKERLVMGFMINQGTTHACKKVSPWGVKSYNRTKSRIANSLHKIKHWKIHLESYENIPNQDATWFIDPPYQFGGHKYSCSNRHIDFYNLAMWSQSRKGQIIVCENTKATWMDFTPLISQRGARYTTTEAIWTNLPSSITAQQIDLFDEFESQP